MLRSSRATLVREKFSQVYRDHLKGYLGFKLVRDSLIMEVSEISEPMEFSTGLNTNSLTINEYDYLEFKPEELTSVQHLYINDTYCIKSFGGHAFTALKTLCIQKCKELEFLPHAEGAEQYALDKLSVGSSCDSLITLPLGFFPNLIRLCIWDCANLESLSMPEGIHNKDLLKSLKTLDISDCPKFVSFPKRGLPTPNLISIFFSNCKNLKELPHELHTLNSLKSMTISDCPQLVSLSQGGLPPRLSTLSITFCDKLMLGKEWGLHKLDCLRWLEIEGGCKNVYSFPDENLLPSNLNSLRVTGLSNLKHVNCKELQHLTALKTLKISHRFLPQD